MLVPSARLFPGPVELSVAVVWGVCNDTYGVERRSMCYSESAFSFG